MWARASIHPEEVDGSSALCQCGKEAAVIFHCDKCEGKVCASCCSHCPRKSNHLYQKHLYIISVEKIADAPNQFGKEVRGGCLTNNGQIAVLCCYNLRNLKSFWKLCYTGGTGKLISDIIPTRDTGTRLPGQLTFSETTRTTYMTAPAKKIVYKISSYNDVYIAFETPGKCFGIACFDRGLAISILIETDFTLPQWQIQYFEFNGHLKKRITHDKETKQQLFISPRFLASNSKDDTLFVSDNGTRTITALDVNGRRLFQYSSGIHDPHGLAVDLENNIYVADGYGVVQIEAGGKDSNIFLENKAASIRDKTVAVLYCCKRNIFVVITSNGTVTKFTLDSKDTPPEKNATCFSNCMNY